MSSRVIRRGVRLVVLVLALALAAFAPRTVAQSRSPLRTPTARTGRAAISARARPIVQRGAPRRRVAARIRRAAAALRSGDFATPIDRTALRRASPDVSEATFAVRWRGALASPAAFLRAFPAGFLADLRAVGADAPGGSGIVFGDLHPDNFGFVRAGGATRFVFNDLDDGGAGSVAFDAARYFTALRLWGYDEGVVGAALDAYAHDLAHPAALDPTRLPRGVRAPTWRRSARRDLAAVTHGDRFVRDAATGLDDAPRDVAAEITAQLARGEGALHRYTVLDVAQRDRLHGGSAGLARYWVLAACHGERVLLEYKEAARPAVETLAPPAQGALAMDARLDVLKRTFWGTAAPHDHVYATLQGRRFLVRNRLGMDNVRVGRLADDDLRRMLRAQVRLMAAVHAPAWGGTSPAEARTWLDASSRVLATRWRDAWQRARDAPPPVTHD